MQNVINSRLYAQNQYIKNIQKQKSVCLFQTKNFQSWYVIGMQIIDSRNIKQSRDMMSS